jgi:hypothetical protein
MWVLSWIFALGLLSACGSPKETGFDEFVDIEAHTFFTLRNHTYFQGPEKIPGLERAPLGAMVALVRTSATSVNPYLCTVTHAAPGYVITASHCVQRFVDRPRFVSVVFYDQSHQLTSRRALSIHILAVASQRDVAVIRIDRQNLSWDSWSDSLADFSKTTARLGNGNFQATVWSLDPIDDLQDLEPKHSIQVGMVANPRRCTGSPIFPTLTGIQPSSQGTTPVMQPSGPGNLLESRSLVRENFLYFDGCDQSWREGNSGAVITAEVSEGNSGLAPAAVASAIYKLSKRRLQGDVFQYSGPAGMQTILKSADFSIPLFGVGGTFDGNLFESKLTPASSALRFDTL